jgi:hypothetical protein
VAGSRESGALRVAALAVFAAALFAAVLAVPFAIEGRLRESHPESDARGDPVVPFWGGIAVALLILVLLSG